MRKKQFVFLSVAIAAVVLIYLIPKKAKEDISSSPTEEISASKTNEPSSSEHLNQELQVADNNAVKNPNESTNLIAAELFRKSFSEQTDSSLVSQLSIKAIQYYQKVLAINPDNLEAKTGLGWCYATSTSDPMRGIMLLREVVTANPEHENAQFNLGLLSMQSGQYQKAIDRFEKVKSINSENYLVLLRLAEAYIASGNSGRALETLQELKKKNPESHFLAEAEKLMEKARNSK